MPSEDNIQVQGILVKADIGMGLWRLQSNDGTSIDLYGNIPKELKGKRVRVTGHKVSMGIGIGKMAIKVHDIRAE